MQYILVRNMGSEASTDSDFCSIDAIDTIVVATRHNTHAVQVLMALESRNMFSAKSLFV